MSPTQALTLPADRNVTCRARRTDTDVSNKVSARSSVSGERHMWDDLDMCDNTGAGHERSHSCLLYTSDAADDM
eukprot:5790800-Alexandrium_andersonii.AAC.1